MYHARHWEDEPTNLIPANKGASRAGSRLFSGRRRLGLLNRKLQNRRRIRVISGVAAVGAVENQDVTIKLLQYASQTPHAVGRNDRVLAAERQAERHRQPLRPIFRAAFLVFGGNRRFGSAER